MTASLCVIAQFLPRANSELRDGAAVGIDLRVAISAEARLPIDIFIARIDRFVASNAGSSFAPGIFPVLEWITLFLE